MPKNILDTKSNAFQEKVNNAPKLPGIYKYLSKDGEVLYVGKAKNLFNRVKSYFNNFERLELKRKNLIEQASDIELITVDSEVDALLLETNVIKKYQPKYNVLMRDDKNYIYVRFEKIRRKDMKPPKKNSVYQDFPRIKIVRNKKDDGAIYFGPYPDKLPAVKLLRRLRKIYPYRTDNDLVYIDYNSGKIVNKNKKPSLYYHLGLDKGTTEGLETKEEYVKRYKEIIKFFEGKKTSMKRKIEKRMTDASSKKQYELAAKYRDQLQNLKYITANIRIDNDVDDIAISDIKKKYKAKAVDNLIKELNFPDEKLKNHKKFRIECYDISNIQGTNAVGAMSVMIDGQIKPNLYRRFKIRMKNEPNDFAMLQEVLTRRFKQLVDSQIAKLADEGEFDNDLYQRAKNWKPDESFAQKPDLIIIDGGKGQLASTYKILYSFGLHSEIPIVGLAKREEELFKITDQFKDETGSQINDSSMFTKVKLKRKTEELFLVQRIRDEAHRFGITYHRNLRSKKFLESTTN